MPDIYLSKVEEAVENLKIKLLAEKKIKRLQNKIDHLVKEMTFTEKDEWIERSIRINEGEGKI